MPADTETRISRFAELTATAVVAGYREEQKRQLLGETSQRPFLIDSLLEGRALDRWSLWEAASCLRLPASGPFVVMAAEVPARGYRGVASFKSKRYRHGSVAVPVVSRGGFIAVGSSQQRAQP
jgi:hypothetical protein